MADEEKRGIDTAPELVAGEVPMNGAGVPRRLVAKLSRVLGELERIPKLGINQDQGYNFVRESDVCDAIRRELAKVGVFVFSTIQSYSREPAFVSASGKQMHRGLVWVTFTFMDGESGERWEVQYPGEALDFGDKGLYKAITGAMKYMLMKEFLLSSGDDPENDSHGEEPPKRDGKAAQPPRAPAPIRSGPAQSKLHEQALELAPLVARICTLDPKLTPDAVIGSYFQTTKGKALTWDEVREFRTEKQFRWVIGGIAALRKQYGELLAAHPEAESPDVPF